VTRVPISTELHAAVAEKPFDDRLRCNQRQLVVFAAAQGQAGGPAAEHRAQLRTYWYSRYLDPDADAARLRHVTQILDQAIAYINRAAHSDAYSLPPDCQARLRSLLRIDQAAGSPVCPRRAVLEQLKPTRAV